MGKREEMNREWGGEGRGKGEVEELGLMGETALVEASLRLTHQVCHSQASSLFTQCFPLTRGEGHPASLSMAQASFRLVALAFNFYVCLATCPSEGII